MGVRINNLMLAGMVAGLLGIAGCESKEKIVDIETPGGEVEVHRDRATGETDVEVSRDP